MSTKTMFNDARGAASTLQMAPPFSFSDVKMTVFPLQANLARLNQFCDGYLNQARDIVQFRPFLPFVYLIILDYGRMSAAAAQTGWVSQREVAFGIPLRWLKPGPEGMAFHDLAFTTPFIFVDNELSLSTGREVYGWPKLLARLDPTEDEWLRDPHGPRQVFEIRSKAAADHAGDDLKAPFLSVTQTPLSGLMDFPPRLDSMTKAASALPNALLGAARYWRDLAAMGLSVARERGAGAPPIAGMPDLKGFRAAFDGLGEGREGETGLQRIAGGVGGMLSSIFPNLYSNTINLKQFRDAAEPAETCYQALTAAKMPITRFGGGGFLGSQNMLAGQIDGGYRVHIMNTATVPLVASLGLVPAETRHVEGGLLGTFAPVSPFWVEIDMLYGKAETLAQRSRSGRWTWPATGLLTPSGDPSPSMSVANDPDAPPPQEAEPEAPQEDPGGFHKIEPSNPFNTTRGASEALGGVFRFPDARVRVLPLLADQKTLDKFVADYVEVPDHIRVAAWGRHVYLVASNYRKITSDLNPSARFTVSETTFAVPVKCYEWEGPRPRVGTAPYWTGDEGERWRAGAERLLGCAIVTPFNYVNDIGAAITESEIFGVPSLRSEISSPPVGWSGERDDEGVLLDTKAIVVPMLGAKAEGERKTLLRVRDGSTIKRGDDAEWGRIAGPWGALLAEDMSAKLKERGAANDPSTAPGHWTSYGFPFECARGAALRMLSGLNGVNTLGLKQFRDAGSPEKACYQGVVMRPTRIEKLHALDEIDKDLTVEITRFPTQPVAKILGLIPKRTKVTDEGVCDEFEPIRPFEVSADLIKERGKTLYERVGDAPWATVDLPEGMLGWRHVRPEDVERQARVSPRPKIAYVWRDRRGGRAVRYDPAPLNKAVLDRFKTDLNSGEVRDLKLLSRDVPLGTLWREDGLRAMDEGRIDDISLFARTRLSEGGDVDADGDADAWREPTGPEDADEDELKAHQLAGALEFVTPATILDTMLSRRWVSRRHQDPDDMARAADFHLRRGSFGPAFAKRLFPRDECHKGTWPPSEDALDFVHGRMRGARMQFTAELRAFLADFSDAGGHDSPRSVILGMWVRAMPNWFAAEYLADIGDEGETRAAAEKAFHADHAAPTLTELRSWTYAEALDVRAGVVGFFTGFGQMLKERDIASMERYASEYSEKEYAIRRAFMNEKGPEAFLDPGFRYLRNGWLRLLDRLLPRTQIDFEALLAENAVDTLKTRLSGLTLED